MVEQALDLERKGDSDSTRNGGSKSESKSQDDSCVADQICRPPRRSWIQLHANSGRFPNDASGLLSTLILP